MFGWIGELTGQERKTLIATYGGWSVDAFDFIYNFVQRRRRIFHRAVSQPGARRSACLPALPTWW